MHTFNTHDLMRFLAAIFFLSFSYLVSAQGTINTDRPGASFSSSVVEKGGVNFQFGSAFQKINNPSQNPINYLGGDMLFRFGLLSVLEFNLGYQINLFDFGNSAQDYTQHVFPILGTRLQLLDAEKSSVTLLYFYERPFISRNVGDRNNVQTENFHQIFLSAASQIKGAFAGATNLKSNLSTGELGITINLSYSWDVIGVFAESVNQLRDASKFTNFTSSWAGDGYNLGMFLDVSPRFRADLALSKNYSNSNNLLSFGISAKLK